MCNHTHEVRDEVTDRLRPELTRPRSVRSRAEPLSDRAALGSCPRAARGQSCSRPGLLSANCPRTEHTSCSRLGLLSDRAALGQSTRALGQSCSRPAARAEHSENACSGNGARATAAEQQVSHRPGRGVGNIEENTRISTVRTGLGAVSGTFRRTRARGNRWPCSPPAAGPLAGRFFLRGLPGQTTRVRGHAPQCVFVGLEPSSGTSRTVCQLHRPGRGVNDLIEPDGSAEMRSRPLCSDPCGGEQITGCSRPCEGDRSRAASGQSCSRTERSRTARAADQRAEHGQSCSRTARELCRRRTAARSGPCSDPAGHAEEGSAGCRQGDATCPGTGTAPHDRPRNARRRPGTR